MQRQQKRAKASTTNHTKPQKRAVAKKATKAKRALKVQPRRTFTTKPIQQQQATLFGAYGQTGPYAAQYLGPTGMRMVAAYRDDGHSVRHLKLVGEPGQVAPKFFDWRDENSVRETLTGSDLVINMIGSSTPTMHFNEYDANLRTALKIAKTAKEMGVQRFIHVSAAGASPHSGSKFLRAKYESEEAVKTYFPNATIVRPCFIFDTNNVYMHTLARAANSDLAIVSWADTEIQPTYARDVGAAIAQLALHPEIDGQTWTLGGQDSMTRAELYHRFSNMIAHKDSAIGAAAQRVHLLDNGDSYKLFTKEQFFFSNVINRNTPVGECDYFATDVTLAGLPKTKGFAELGIKPSETNLALMRIGKAYLSNLSPANSNKLFTWDTGCIDEKVRPISEEVVGEHIPIHMRKWKPVEISAEEFQDKAAKEKAAVSKMTPQQHQLYLSAIIGNPKAFNKGSGYTDMMPRPDVVFDRRTAQQVRQLAMSLPTNIQPGTDEAREHIQDIFTKQQQQSKTITISELLQVAQNELKA